MALISTPPGERAAGRSWLRTARHLLGQARLELRAGRTPWTLAALVVVALVVLPIVSIFGGVLGPAGDTWRHLADTVLADYLVNSGILMAGVGTLTLALGIGTAWLVTTCEFPLRRIFEWALILPLSVPTYIVAYTYAGIVDYGGPAQAAVGAVLGPGAATALRPAVVSLPGAVILLALVLYPYVYLITRTSFQKQSATLLESSQILGRSAGATFFRVALPLARPGWVGGVTLVLMEVLNEYGAVKYFGIPTFTTGIFRAWFSLGDADAAVRLSGCLLLFVLVLVVLERAQRGRARFETGPGADRPARRFRLGGGAKWAAVAACGLPVLLGFLLPVAQLLGWAVAGARSYVDRGFLVLAANSFGLAVLAALLTVAAALLVVYAVRLSPTPILKLARRVSILGYSIPGAVIAVGVLLPFVWVDNQVDALARAALGTSTGLILSGTVAALTFAYVVRFLAVALNPLDSGFERLCGNLDETSRSLGAPPLRTLFRVNLPLLKGTLVGAGLLVFVDVLKELPLTLILRPFNFDTLATTAYQLATDEQLTQSALPALLVIAVGLAPVVFLNRLIRKAGDETTRR